MADATIRSFDELKKDCRRTLADFFNSESVPLSNNVDWAINGFVEDYLVRNGCKDFLSKDVTDGYAMKVGSIADIVLMQFAKEGTVFKSENGNYKIDDRYAIHSIRFYIATQIK